jgi:hypothetical protein
VFFCLQRYDTAKRKSIQTKSKNIFADFSHIPVYSPNMIVSIALQLGSIQERP